MSAALQLVYSRPEQPQETKRMQDGFVAVPNGMMDALLSADLTGRQLKMALAVIRKTIGYGKADDDCTITQLAELAGMERSNASVTFQQLVAMNVIGASKGKHGYLVRMNSPELWQEKSNTNVSKQYSQNDTNVSKQYAEAYQNDTHNRQLQQTITTTPLPPEGEVADATAGQNQKSGSAKPAVPYAAILQAYREALPELAQPDLLTDARKKTIAARWKQVLNTVDPLGRVRYSGVDDGVIWWSRLFAKVRMNPHWMGNNDRAWAASFDWIMGPQNFLKVLEWRPVEVQP